MLRERKAKIIATLGPAVRQCRQITELFIAGADVFRLNFSHGEHADHRRSVKFIRDIEAEAGRPIGIVLDLQGPKLRLGAFANGPVTLKQGDIFRFDTSSEPGDRERVQLPHAEIYSALKPGVLLLVDDGRLRMVVRRQTADALEVEVQIGGPLSDLKGVNVPGVLLPLSPLTEKDKQDLQLGLELGIDWVALSFVQRASDFAELRELVAGRAAIMGKLEKPAALNSLNDIVMAADGIMIARGDLGVELPPEQVPGVQKRIMSVCRQAGKPVVVATQMLESMIYAPLPTRAEASDVATAIYDGADAVMLSAETAIGKYSRDSVSMMDRIVTQTERDRHYAERLKTQHLAPESTTADAICFAMQTVAHTLDVALAVTYTNSGFSAFRAARERPQVPILGLTPNLSTARRLTLVWGVYSVHHEHQVTTVEEMVDSACRAAVREKLAQRGERVVIAAGQPFGTSGTTNLLRVARVPTPRKRSRSQ